MTSPTGTPPKGKGKGGKSLFKDKRVLYGVAGVGGIGLIVLLRKGTAPATASGDGTSGQPISPANLDSSGTDNYNAIASIGQAWQDQWTQAFGQFSDQLGDISDQLGQVNGPTATTPPPSTKPATKPTNTVGHGTAPGWGWYTVKPGDNYAKIEKAAGISWSTLLGLNGKGNLNRLDVGEKIKTRYAAGPKPK
jgi:hypothetical protein